MITKRDIPFVMTDFLAELLKISHRLKPPDVVKDTDVSYTLVSDERIVNMPKYRKKPVVIEAFRYDGDLMDSKGNYYAPGWAVKALEEDILFFKHQGELFVKTLERDMAVTVGDYIIKGVNNELYPCEPDVFEKTYDLVLS